jgi:hypothetical protein
MSLVGNQVSGVAGTVGVTGAVGCVLGTVCNKIAGTDESTHVIGTMTWVVSCGIVTTDDQ